MADPRLRRCIQCNLKFVWMRGAEQICSKCKRIRKKEWDKEWEQKMERIYNNTMYKYVKRENNNEVTRP